MINLWYMDVGVLQSLGDKYAGWASFGDPASHSVIQNYWCFIKNYRIINERFLCFLWIPTQVSSEQANNSHPDIAYKKLSSFSQTNDKNWVCLGRIDSHF